MAVLDDDRRATYRQVFGVPQFRVLFVARCASVAAASLRIFAFSMLVYSATGSPLLAAVAFGAGFLPQAIGGLLLGALADRLSARPVIAAGYVLEAALAAALGLLHPPTVVCLMMVAVVSSVAPIFGGAVGRLTAELLEGDAYVLGRAVNSMSAAVAQLGGLALGASVVAATGVRPALLLAAAANVLAACTVWLGLPARPRPKDPRERVAVAANWRGSRRMLRDRTLRRLLLAQWVPLALSVGVEAVLVPYSAERRYPPGAAGVLLAALPAGMLLGDFVVGRFVRPARREALSAPLIILLGAPLPLLLLPLNLPMTAMLLMSAGAGSAYLLGLQRPFLDAVLPEQRGHAFSLLSTGLMSLQGLGALMIGSFADVTSPSVAIAATGAAIVLLTPLATTHTRRAS